MAIETASSARELPVSAAELHRLAMERVAARQGSINEVSAEIKTLSHQLLENPDSVQGLDESVAKDPTAEPEAPAATVAEGEGDTVPSPDAKEKVAEAQELHQADMVAVHGDQNAHLFSGDDGTLGYFSGGNKVFHNVNGGVTSATWLHENDHRKNGFIEGVGLDEALAKDVKDELPAFVEARDDDEMLNLAQRDVHEKSATEAGGRTPSAYKTESGYVLDQGGDDVFFVVRMIVSCCAVDAQPIGVPVYRPGWRAELEPSTWIALKGTFIENTDQASDQQTVIKVASLSKIDEPDQPYVF